MGPGVRLTCCCVLHRQHMLAGWRWDQGWAARQAFGMPSAAAAMHRCCPPHLSPCSPSACCQAGQNLHQRAQRGDQDWGPGPGSPGATPLRARCAAAWHLTGCLSLFSRHHAESMQRSAHHSRCRCPLPPGLLGDADLAWTHCFNARASRACSCRRDARGRPLQPVHPQRGHLCLRPAHAGAGHGA